MFRVQSIYVLKARAGRYGIFVFGIELVIRSAGSVIEYIYSCIKIICLTGTYI